MSEHPPEEHLHLINSFAYGWRKLNLIYEFEPRGEMPEAPMPGHMIVIAQKNVARVEALKSTLAAPEDLPRLALQFVTSHPVQPVAIPGAKSVQQAAMNAEAGSKFLSIEERNHLLQNLDPTAKTVELPC